MAPCAAIRSFHQATACPAGRPSRSPMEVRISSQVRMAVAQPSLASSLTGTPACGPRRSRRNWCRGGDSNSYALASTAPSKQRVYLFHHLGRRAEGRFYTRGHRPPTGRGEGATSAETEQVAVAEKPREHQGEQAQGAGGSHDGGGDQTGERTPARGPGEGAGTDPGPEGVGDGEQRRSQREPEPHPAVDERGDGGEVLDPARLRDCGEPVGGKPVAGGGVRDGLREQGGERRVDAAGGEREGA